MKYDLTLELIAKANSFLKNKIRPTFVEYSPILSDLVKRPVYLKLESLQITGSFKVRGALFYLACLSDQEKEKGVATCSAGNHGLGVAYAAKQLGLACTVYVPKTVDRSKKEKILQLNAKVIESPFDGYDETLIWAKKQTKKHFISAFEDERIMAANGGTIASEILTEVPDVETVLFPVGGGGLGAGMSFYLKNQKPSIRLIGCQHVHSPALKYSLEKDQAVTTLPPIKTIAGGIEGGIGEKCFEIIKSRIDEVSLLKEEEISHAVCWMLKTHQYLIEPSAAVTVASCLYHKASLKGKVVVLISGRNVAYETLQKLIKNASFF